MTKTPDQERRQARLKALLEHTDFDGNKSELARVMGWKGGAYVRQLVAGERPITEKTVLAIESAHGGKYRGWFASEHVAAPPAAISPQDADLLDDLAQLPPAEQASWRAEIHAAAEYAREIRSWQPSSVPASDVPGEVVTLGAASGRAGRSGLTSIKSRRSGTRQHPGSTKREGKDETG